MMLLSMSWLVSLLAPALALAFTAYNDLAWAPGQRDHHITMITSPHGHSGLPSHGELIDFYTGLPTGIRLTVAGGEFDPESHISASGRANRGEAHGVFNGKVSTRGSISYQALPSPEGDLVLTFTGLRQDARYSLVFYGHRNRYAWDRASTVTLSGAVSFTNASSTGSDDNNRALFSDPDDRSTRLPADNDNGWIAHFSDIDAGEDGEVGLTIAWDGASDTDRHRYRGKYANAIMLREIRDFTAYNDLAWTPGQLERHITMITSPNPDKGGPGLPSQGQLLDFASGRSTPVTLQVQEGLFEGEAHVERSGSPAPDTDVFAIFDGKVSALGSISYPGRGQDEDDLLLTLRDLQPHKRYELVFYGHRDRYGWYRASIVELLGAAFFTNTSSQGLDDNGAPLFAGPDDLSTRLPADNDAGWVARYANIYPGDDGEVTLRIRWSGTSTSERDDAFRGKYANALSLRQHDPLPFTVDSTADAIDVRPGDGVCTTAAGTCTLRAAVQEANALEGLDRILVPAGIYSLVISGADEEAAASGDLDVTDHVALIGTGMEQTVLDSRELDRMLHIHHGSAAKIASLTLQQGVATDGGAIRNDGRATLIDIQLRDNAAVGNAQGEAGGGIYNNLGGTLAIRNSHIVRNLAGRPDTTGPCDGGGVYNRGVARLIQTVIGHNTAGAGEETAGRCVGAGGGIFNRGQLELMESDVHHNRASDMAGGVASIGGGVDLRRSTVADNRSQAAGGGLGFVGTTATVFKSMVARNGSHGASGGGIDNDRGSTLVVTHSTISDNTVSDSDAIGSGGGIHNHLSQLHIHGSTLSRNTAVGSGGGLMNAGGLATITNSTLSDNAAQGIAVSEGDGGAIWTSLLLRIVNSTISANRAARDGGGIDGPAALINSIVAANTAGEAGPDCHGGVMSEGHNLIGDADGCASTLQASDLTGDAGLGSFTDDGTPGGGHFPLLPHSPAIDAGAEDACGPTDQLTQPRTDGCDIGAVEFF